MGCKGSKARYNVTSKSITIVTLNTDLYVSSIKWLPRDLKKGEQLKLYNNHSYGLTDNNAVTVTLINEKSHWFELSNDYLIFN